MKYQGVGREVGTRPLWPAASEVRCSAVLATDLYTYSRLSLPNPKNLRRARSVDSDWLPAHTRAPPRPCARRSGHSRSGRVRDRPASRDAESPPLSLQEDSWLRRTESHTCLDRYDSISLVRSQSDGRHPEDCP